jgi:hypothetical protein
MAKRKTLSKEDLLHPKSTKLELVEVPSLGGSVYVRGLSGLGLLQYKREIEALGNPRDWKLEQSLGSMTLIISLTVCDEAGNLLFTRDEADQLLNNGLDVVEMLAEKAAVVSGISRKDLDEAKNSLKNPLTLSPSTATLPENSVSP